MDRHSRTEPARNPAKYAATAHEEVPLDLRIEPIPDGSRAQEPASQGAAVVKGDDRHLPDLPTQLEDLDDQFFSPDARSLKPNATPAAENTRGAGSAPSGATPEAAASLDAAQEIFMHRKTASLPIPWFAVSVGIVTLIAFVAIGMYFYWQIQPKGGLIAGPELAARQSGRDPLPVPTTVRQETALPAISAAPTTLRPQRSGSAERDPVAPQLSNELAEKAVAPLPAPLKLYKHAGPAISVTASRVNSPVLTETAHEAYSRGETDLARTIWLQLLQSDHRNAHALQGLATIAQSEGKPEQAAKLYLFMLEANPKNAAALAGLLSIDIPVDSRQLESQLKGLLAEQPDSSHLHFSLGLLYMNELRWAEAQQSFFMAHVADPSNPDYLYNLAVCLDHLRQTGLAAQYYARALVAANSRVATFGPALAEARIKQLQTVPVR